MIIVKVLALKIDLKLSGVNIVVTPQNLILTQNGIKCSTQNVRTFLTHNVIMQNAGDFVALRIIEVYVITRCPHGAS